MSVPLLLLNALEDLGKEDFLKFKWHLSQTCKIPRSRLENAARTNTVDEIMKRHTGQAAVAVTADILKQMSFNAAADELLSSYAGGNPATPSTSSSAAVPPATPAAPAAMTAQQSGVIIAPTISGNSGAIHFTFNK